MVDNPDNLLASIEGIVIEEKNQPKENNCHRNILFPAYTWDYRVQHGKYGLGLFANRNIKKGDLIFSDSLEYMFADVNDGDMLLFERSALASKASKTKVPETIPLTREVLTRTHGVPVLKSDTSDSCGSIVSWRLEVPAMLGNHSCNPNVIDDSHDDAKGESRAAKNIRKGEELTYDYTFQYYDHGPLFETCMCGSKKCRGKMMGFKGLTEEDKEKVLPKVSGAVKAMYFSDIGKGPKIRKHQMLFPTRTFSESYLDKNVMRLVFPGPSYAMADIEIKKNDATGAFGLYALKTFDIGDKVYEFWTQDWPKYGNVLIDMVFSSDMLKGDPSEGTTIRVDCHECASRDREGKFQFSGWDLLTKHSCSPNIVYNYVDEYEDDDWHGAYAVKKIEKGEELCVDFNNIFWDRTEWKGLGSGKCQCATTKCSGTVKGFKFLSESEKNERKWKSWKNETVPQKTNGKPFTPGEALSPYIRVSWRAFCDDAPETGSSSSSSSSEEEFSTDSDFSDE